MSVYQIDKLLLTLAGCLVWQLSLAQQAAVAPLAPRQVLVQPATPSLGIPVRTKWQTGIQLTSKVLYADTSAQPTQPPRIYRPVMLLNSRLIIGDKELQAMNPNDITDLNVYKGADAPPRWRSLTPNGIIDIKLKTKPKIGSKTLLALRRQLGVVGPVRFELDGVPLEDTSLRIATDAIDRVDLVRLAVGESGSTLLNIKIVRLPPKPTPPGKYPPGTIFIRGVAGR
jgi:hypothetical protein